MATWAFSLLSVIAVSLVSLVGLLTLSLNESRMQRVALTLVSFAVGTLLGDAFIHLLPEVFGKHSTPALKPSLLVLAGMMVFFVVEKLLRHWHAPLYEQHEPASGKRPELAAINLFGDGIHNFIDGVLIGASYLVSPALGLSTTIAVVFHEIPQEFGDFGILIHSGLTVRRAAALNLLSASAAILGTIAILVVGTAVGTAVSDLLVPVTAGGFVYLAAADLIPELQHDSTLRALLVQAVLILLGIVVMAALTLVE